VSVSPRILFVTHNFPRFVGDAAGSFVLRLARALIDAGAEVHVLAPAAAGLAERDEIEGVPVQRVRYAREDRQVLAYEGTMVEAVRGSWGGRFALLGLLWQMARAVREAVATARRAGTPYDVVHAHWWFPAGLSAWHAGAGGSGMPPLVVTMHGSDVRLAQRIAPSHWFLRRVLGRAVAVTAVSQWLARTAESLVPEVDVHVAPMPVPVERFAPPTREHAARDGVLFVGRLNAQKGVADLLDALAKTSAPVRCDLVGDGPDRASLHARARELGVADRLTWHGALPGEALPALYQAAAVTVMPSREEGLGLVAVESQLCGTPVIGYDSGGLPDVVSPSAGGTLVAVGDIARLAAAIDRIIDSPTEASRLGEIARGHVLQLFSPQHVAARYLALYDASSETVRG
jgi:glycosyltransferase involved in cell wall biosynthesis